jgi:hypothetical protein
MDICVASIAHRMRLLHRFAVLTGRAQIIEGLLTVVVAAIAWVCFYRTTLQDSDASFH